MGPEFGADEVVGESITPGVTDGTKEFLLLRTMRSNPSVGPRFKHDEFHVVREKNKGFQDVAEFVV